MASFPSTAALQHHLGVITPALTALSSFSPSPSHLDEPEFPPSVDSAVTDLFPSPKEYQNCAAAGNSLAEFAAGLVSGEEDVPLLPFAFAEDGHHHHQAFPFITTTSNGISSAPFSSWMDESLHPHGGGGGASAPAVEMYPLFDFASRPTPPQNLAAPPIDPPQLAFLSKELIDPLQLEMLRQILEHRSDAALYQNPLLLLDLYSTPPVPAAAERPAPRTVNPSKVAMARMPPPNTITPSAIEPAPSARANPALVFSRSMKRDREEEGETEDDGNEADEEEGEEEEGEVDSEDAYE
ncbi:hypothetical protein HDU67_005985, partial [Dinochytrium kinnereticum]